MLLIAHMVTVTRLNYNPLKHWKKYLIAGTDREDWVHE